MLGDKPPPHWQKAKPSVRVDDELEKLIKNGLLRGGFQGDPYLTTRCYVGRAIALARIKDREQKANANFRDALINVEHRVRGLEKRLKAVAADAKAVLSRPVTAGLESSDTVGHLERIGLPGKALDAVQALAAGLRAHRKNIRQKSEEVSSQLSSRKWFTAGSASLAKQPARSNDRFLKLVSEAHTTLGVASPATLKLPFHVEPWDVDEERERNGKIESGRGALPDLLHIVRDMPRGGAMTGLEAVFLSTIDAAVRGDRLGAANVPDPAKTQLLLVS